MSVKRWNGIKVIADPNVPNMPGVLGFVTSQRVCGGCGHPYDPGEFCTVCRREFCCGRASEPCDVPGCAERHLAAEFDDAVRFDHAASEWRVAEPRQYGDELGSADV